MPLDVRPCPTGERSRIRELLLDPSLSHEYGTLASPDAFESFMSDPFLHDDATLLGFVDGEVAGFAASFLVHGNEGMFGFTRVGVLERQRRRGLGRALVEASRRILQRGAGSEVLHKQGLGAWVPTPVAEDFAAGLGFVPERTYWRMGRPIQPVPDPDWRAGTTIETLDGSERALADWNDAYNRSFAGHHHFVRSSVDDLRKLLGTPVFDPRGLRLAHRDGRCVGFCRNTIADGAGEISSVGVTPEARGLGLGRALLRDGVDWLQRQAATRVELLVDGENESALRLYRSEGFEVIRTRRLWSFWLAPRAGAAS